MLARFRRGLAGQRVAVQGLDGQALGLARVSPTGSLSGLNRLFTLKPGDFFRVAVVAEGLQVELLPKGPADTADLTKPVVAVSFEGIAGAG